MSEPSVMVTLPDELRSEMKEPLGPIYTDADTLLDESSLPLICVGDMVTHHCLAAGRVPDVAVVDGKTQREEVQENTETMPDWVHEVHVVNPAGTLTAELLVELEIAIISDTPHVIVVDGEEDLATLPSVCMAPPGASIVYGQPGEGMVLATVTDGLRKDVKNILQKMDSDYDSLSTMFPMYDVL